MAYRVELTARALRDLRHVFVRINAEHSPQAAAWFGELETVILSLNEHPERGPATPEKRTLRHLLFGKKPHVYRIIYAVHEPARIVRILHVRHGARAPF
jgi:plasmid stabilization system protein ParE